MSLTEDPHPRTGTPAINEPVMIAVPNNEPQSIDVNQNFVLAEPAEAILEGLTILVLA